MNPKIYSIALQFHSFFAIYIRLSNPQKTKSISMFFHRFDEIISFSKDIQSNHFHSIFMHLPTRSSSFRIFGLVVACVRYVCGHGQHIRKTGKVSMLKNLFHFSIVVDTHRYLSRFFLFVRFLINLASFSYGSISQTEHWNRLNFKLRITISCCLIYFAIHFILFIHS